MINYRQIIGIHIFLGPFKFNSEDCHLNKHGPQILHVFSTCIWTLPDCLEMSIWGWYFLLSTGSLVSCEQGSVSGCEVKNSVASQFISNRDWRTKAHLKKVFGKSQSQGLCNMNWVPRQQHPFLISSLIPMGAIDFTLVLVGLNYPKPKKKVLFESGVFY